MYIVVLDHCNPCDVMFEAMDPLDIVRVRDRFKFMLEELRESRLPIYFVRILSSGAIMSFWCCNCIVSLWIVAD